MLYTFIGKNITCEKCMKANLNLESKDKMNDPEKVWCPLCKQHAPPHTHPTGVKTKNETDDWDLVGSATVADLLEAINKAPKEFLKCTVNVYEVKGRKFPVFEILPLKK
jgi:hypothetical protein